MKQALTLLSLVAWAGSAHADTILVSGNDNAVHRISSDGRDLGVFAATGLSNPMGLALDRAGNVHVASAGDNTVRRFSPSGEYRGISALVGLSVPSSLVFDRHGNLFVTNLGDNSVRKFRSDGEPLGVVLSLLGQGCPGGLAFDRHGNLLVTDPCADLIRRVSPRGGAPTTFATNGLRSPNGVAIHPSGDLFVANTGDGIFGHTIHRFSATGQDRETVVRLGETFPDGLAFERSGALLVTDQTQRPGTVDYAILRFWDRTRGLEPVVVVPFQPRSIVVIPTRGHGCGRD